MDERDDKPDIEKQREVERLVGEAEGRVLAMLDKLDYGYYVVDFAGNIREVNEAACRIFGRRRGDLIGTNNREFMTPEAAKNVYAVFNEVYRTGKPKRAADGKIVRPDGSTRVVQASISMAYSSAGEPNGFAGIIHDVTEIRIASKKSGEQEATLRAITEAARDAIIMMDDAGAIAFWNPAAERIFGYSAEEAIGRDLHKFLTADEFKSRFEEAFPRFKNTGTGNAVGKTLRLEGLRKSGDSFPLELSLSSSKLKGRFFAIAIVHDITETLKAEEALRASEERYRLLFDFSPIGIFRTSLSGKVVDANRSALKMLGYNENDVKKGIIVKTLYADPEKRKEVIAELGRSGSLENEFVELRRKDGSTFKTLLNAVVEKEEENTGERHIYGTFADFSDRMKMQETLERSERRYRLLFEQNLSAVYTMDLEGRLLDCNDAFSRMFGFDSPEEAVKASFSKEHSFTADAGDHDGFMKTLRETGIQDNRQTRVRRKNGESFWIHENATLVEEKDREPYILGSAIDLTEVKRTEEERIKGAKFESVAALTQGLAHEIRNPLFAIGVNSEILKGREAQKSGREAVANIQEHVKRLSNLVDSLIELGRSLSDTDLEPLDLAMAIESAASLFRESEAKRADQLVVGEIPDISLRGNSKAVAQVIGELLMNAAEMSPAEGKIAVGFEVKSEKLVISVSNDGPAIDDENIERIFDPFFTTKTGHPGLGLAVCRHLVEAQGGTLSAANKAGGSGVVFTIELPITPLHPSE